MEVQKESLFTKGTGPAHNMDFVVQFDPNPDNTWTGPRIEWKVL